MQEEYIGRVVYSKAGRDKGKALIIVGSTNDQYLLVADGDLRKIESPKKKNIKHLNFSKLTADNVTAYFKRGEVPPNHVIRKTLIALLEKEK